MGNISKGKKKEKLLFFKLTLYNWSDRFRSTVFSSFVLKIVKSFFSVFHQIKFIGRWIHEYDLTACGCWVRNFVGIHFSWSSLPRCQTFLECASLLNKWRFCLNCKTQSFIFLCFSLWFFPYFCYVIMLIDCAHLWVEFMSYDLVDFTKLVLFKLKPNSFSHLWILYSIAYFCI